MYKEFAKLIDEKGITIVSRKISERGSYSGEKLYVRDKNGFLRRDGVYTDKPSPNTIDLSANGFCYNEHSIEQAYNMIIEFYTAINTIDKFKEFIKDRTEEQEESI